MGKSTHFFGQPVYGQLIKSLDHDKIVEISRKHGGERYVKSFDGYTHLLTKHLDKAMEILRAGNYGTNCIDVLPEP